MQPVRRLSAMDVALMVVGIVVGAGIFRVPADVAAASDHGWQVLALWAAGGIAALCGALSYAELATRYPSIGGEFHFLRLAYGARMGALFVWARVAVMQTGAIATVGFVAGDYAASLWPDGPAPAIWAGAAVAGTSIANMLSLEAGRRSQHLFVTIELFAIGAVIAAALFLGISGGGAGQVTGAGNLNSGISMGLALVFIMLAYGGWNEAAYLSAETREGGRDLVKALVLGLGLVTAVYLVVNAAFLFAFGREALAGTPAPATLLLNAAFGPLGAALVSGAIVIASLSTMNATIITGARAMCAMGQHVSLFAPMGRWDQARSVPRPALMLQALVAVALIAYGATTRDGFSAMVAFGAPVFWLFLALTALSLFILRRRNPTAQGFSVPLYPLVPLLFLAVCGYMLWSSLEFAGFLLSQSEAGRLAGILGIFLLLAGIPLIWKAR